MTKIRMTVKKSVHTIAQVDGILNLDLKYLNTRQDLAKLLEVEPLLESLMGLRFHFEEIHE